MNISKFKIVAKYLTGGLASVVEYLLELFNEMIQKLPATEVAKYAQLANDIAVFVRNVATLLITDETKKNVATITAQGFADLANALVDSQMTEDELNQVIEDIKKAIEAWKKA